MSEVNKNCSRCNQLISCKSNNIELCECNKVTISMSTVEHLKNTKYNCLCNPCLQEVDKLVILSDNLPTKHTEGIHYIMEGGNLVFTEISHIQRGYCCGSGCRHCAYG